MAKVSKQGREIHHKVETARELEQDFLKALKLAEEALIIYEEDSDMRGFTEVLQSRSSVYKHLYQKTKNTAFLTLAKHDSLAGIEIAKKLDDKSALVVVYRGLAKILEALGDWQGSAEYFGKAIDAFKNSPPQENNRPSVLSDMKAHYAHALYMSGEKDKGIILMDEAIAEMQKDTKEDKYNIDVWLSGAHMRAAKMLWGDNGQNAQEHLRKAENIISSNSELVLRSNQLGELKKELESSS
jgi:tetratricopeptide (TPR) repeat protein